MTWEIWDPFEDMKKMQKEMDKTFRDFFRKPMKLEKKEMIREPLVDVMETKKDVVVKAELPGIDKKDIELNVTENMIGIKAERKTEAKEEIKGFYRHERSYQSFQRAFSLPARVLPNKSKAKMDKGVLMITIPKAKSTKEEKSQFKRIAIK